MSGSQLQGEADRRCDQRPPAAPFAVLLLPRQCMLSHACKNGRRRQHNVQQHQ
jgi:hypothetical protein